MQLNLLLIVLSADMSLGLWKELFANFKRSYLPRAAVAVVLVVVTAAAAAAAAAAIGNRFKFFNWLFGTNNILNSSK